MTEEMWQAILQNDSTYDGKFYYGVTTTGIFCRPSCKSKHPSKQNVKIFANANQALSANFRPCKRCKPDGLRLPDEEWVRHMEKVIEAHFHEPLTLAALAKLLHASPYHMHRMFKRIRGETPAEYIKRKRMETARALLAETRQPVTEIALQSGYANAAHFSTVFQKQTGLSPTDYRHTFGKVNL
jgi:AraC family transcriptional regulator of adaptative response / methylphosphotriester-DNA alkyltransferase methyltransferase